MATHVFNYAKGEILKGNIDFDAADIRFMFLMTNTTADTENDNIESISDLTTLDEFDGSGYSAGGFALDSEGVTVDLTNDRAEFDAADEACGALGAGTRSIMGVLVYKFVTNNTDSIPISWNEFASPVTADGSSITVQWNAEGILQAA
jgi:hypothetical protein